MSKLNLLEDLLGEATLVHKLTKPELQRAGKKVFQKLKKNLSTHMTKETVHGNVESEMAKTLKLRTMDIRGSASFLVPVQDVIQSTAADLHRLVVQLRKKSGKSFANINEAAKFVPAEKALGNVGKNFKDLEVTTVEIGGESSFLAGWVSPDGEWGVLLTNKPKTRGPDINRLLAKGKASSVAAAKKEVVVALAKQAKKHDNRSR